MVQEIEDIGKEFEKTVHMPNGQTKQFDTNIFNEFMRTEKTDLKYFTHTEIDSTTKVVNVYIIPIVESA